MLNQGKHTGGDIHILFCHEGILGPGEVFQPNHKFLVVTHALGHTFGHPLHFLFDYPFKNPRSTPAHKDAVWSCSDPHEKAWDSVKKLISVPPVSHYYQSAEQLEIPCDSSQSGLGAALIHNGQPIAYASRTFTETESL